MSNERIRLSEASLASVNVCLVDRQRLHLKCMVCGQDWIAHVQPDGQLAPGWWYCPRGKSQGVAHWAGIANIDAAETKWLAVMPCEACRGKGYLSLDGASPFIEDARCPNCNGEGRIMTWLPLTMLMAAIRRKLAAP